MSKIKELRSTWGRWVAPAKQGRRCSPGRGSRRFPPPFNPASRCSNRPSRGAPGVRSCRCCHLQILFETDFMHALAKAASLSYWPKQYAVKGSRSCSNCLSCPSNKYSSRLGFDEWMGHSKVFGATMLRSSSIGSWRNYTVSLSVVSSHEQ